MSSPLRLEQYDLFLPGQYGYNVCRIPVLLTTSNGVLLACCEARKGHRGDIAEIDLLLCRSLDLGETWEEIQVVISDPGMTCGNPVLVQDPATGIIWFVFCKSPANVEKDKLRSDRSFRGVWVTSSDDDGNSWSEPEDMTTQVRKPDWSWCATGPNNGIALASGRLVIPCCHQINVAGNRSDPSHSHIMYSDDHGQTWHVGGLVDGNTNESSVLESIDGHLCLNCRTMVGKGIGTRCCLEP